MNTKHYKNMTIDERIEVHKTKRNLARLYELKSKNKLLDTLDNAPKKINDTSKYMEDIKIWD